MMQNIQLKMQMGRGSPVDEVLAVDELNAGEKLDGHGEDSLQKSIEKNAGVNIYLEMNIFCSLLWICPNSIESQVLDRVT